MNMVSKNTGLVTIRAKGRHIDGFNCTCSIGNRFGSQALAG